MSAFCPQCKNSIPTGTKFCPECGTQAPENPSGSGISIGSDAMVSGDIIGSKSETKVAGNYTNNVTNVTNEDATKSVHKCAISGEHVLFTDLNECPQCRLQVSSRFFDQGGMRCFSCNDRAEAELKSSIEEKLGNDGIIDAAETRSLIQIQTRLKISQKRYQEIEGIVRENLFARIRQNSAVGKTAVPGIGKKVEAATRAVTENKSPLAIKLLEPTWNECQDNREYRDVYLSALLISSPDQLDQELLKFQHEELTIDLLRVRVLLAKGQPEAADRMVLSSHLKAMAYRDQAEWALLPVEIALDRALFEDEEYLAKTYLSEAQEGLDRCSPLEGLDSPTPSRFIIEYLDAVKASAGKRSNVASSLVKMISDAAGFSGAATSDWFKYTVLCSSKLRLLERSGVHLASQATNLDTPPQETQPSQKKCGTCGNLMPSSARFCGSCGNTVAPVTLFLEEIGLEQYADLFSNNRIDESIISELSEQDLKNIGITSLGHRKKIFSSIQEYDW